MEQHDLSKIQKLQEKGKSDKIIKYLSSSDDTVVVAALEALSRIKDEDSVNSIAHMIDNPDTKIRVEAAKALGSIGTEYAKTYLLHRLNAEQDETVKTAIKEALHTLQSIINLICFTRSFSTYTFSLLLASGSFRAPFFAKFGKILRRVLLEATTHIYL